jgi:hypothetical protein
MHDFVKSSRLISFSSIPLGLWFDPDGLRIAKTGTDTLQRLNNIRTCAGAMNIDGWPGACERLR